MNKPKMIIYGDGYKLTADEIVELRLLYGDDVIVRVSEFVPAGKVVTLNIDREPIGNPVHIVEIMSELLQSVSDE